MIDLSKLTTEKRNPNTMNLDTMTPLEFVSVMNKEDGKVIEAVKEVLPEIAKVITWTTEALKNGGRIIYMGAGTSGRLGVLDAVECPPTFGVSPDVVVGLIAGGERAFVKAVEGAEDSVTLGTEDLKEIGLTKDDVVIGIAASGRTPYVIHALRYARSIGVKTAIIACNKDSKMSKEADIAIEPVSGPEVLTGSTRLKAGTAQKLVLNMISTGSMVGIGKAYENLMVDVMQSNEKLKTRAENIVMAATECERDEAREKIDLANGSVKLAITMILLNTDASEASKKLDDAKGHIRHTIDSK
ncbi:MAG: N-acetylmuramic acid 6-phosphate etherase [Clostridium sp.]|nr:N-acetylmuramic acid 6-phosphate etherase [Clostridium sp.]